MPEPSDPLGEPDELEKKGLERSLKFKKLESAYALLHATKPATIGYVLAANPLSLLAWYVEYLIHDPVLTDRYRIAEKFLDWTDEDSPLDVILESVSLYWLTETLPTSIYPYRQVR